MHECPEELRKSAPFILNANGASLLLAGSFGGQGSSKQKGTVEIGPLCKQGDKADADRGCGRVEEGPLHPVAISSGVGDFEAQGYPEARRGHIPEGANAAPGRASPLIASEKLCSWKRNPAGLEEGSQCPKLRPIAPPLPGPTHSSKGGNMEPK